MFLLWTRQMQVLQSCHWQGCHRADCSVGCWQHGWQPDDGCYGHACFSQVWVLGGLPNTDLPSGMLWQCCACRSCKKVEVCFCSSLFFPRSSSSSSSSFIFWSNAWGEHLATWSSLSGVVSPGLKSSILVNIVTQATSLHCTQPMASNCMMQLSIWSTKCEKVPLNLIEFPLLRTQSMVWGNDFPYSLLILFHNSKGLELFSELKIPLWTPLLSRDIMIQAASLSCSFALVLGGLVISVVVISHSFQAWRKQLILSFQVGKLVGPCNGGMSCASSLDPDIVSALSVRSFVWGFRWVCSCLVSTVNL